MSDCVGHFLYFEELLVGARDLGSATGEGTDGATEALAICLLLTGRPIVGSLARTIPLVLPRVVTRAIQDFGLHCLSPWSPRKELNSQSSNSSEQYD